MKKYILIIVLLITAHLSFSQEQTFTTSDGVQLYVKAKGTGMPCLYIHGGPGSGSYWMEKFSGDILEKRFKMIYLDLRGVSRSTSPVNGDYSMNRLLQDFEELRKYLGIDQWLIMGHSFSGTMLTAYARQYASSLRGMMMFNCTLNIEEGMKRSFIPYAIKILQLADASYYNNDTIPLQNRINSLFSLLNKEGVSWKMAYKKKENEAIMNATFREIPNWNNGFAGIGLWHKDYYGINFKLYTDQIKLPVLFFYGKSDWTIDPMHYKGVNFPNMLLWSSKGGHVPFMENKPDLEKAMDQYLKNSSPLVSNKNNLNMK